MRIKSDASDRNCLWLGTPKFSPDFVQRTCPRIPMPFFYPRAAGCACAKEHTSDPAGSSRKVRARQIRIHSEFISGCNWNDRFDIYIIYIIYRYRHSMLFNDEIWQIDVMTYWWLFNIRDILDSRSFPISCSKMDQCDQRDARKASPERPARSPKAEDSSQLQTLGMFM
jgi:hypothetical protein